MSDMDKETEAYLARIRKTVEESKNLVAQAELRMAETDRLLESQGLTREQVMAMRFTEAQFEAANEELKRRGMDPLEKWWMDGAQDESPTVEDQIADRRLSSVESQDTADEVAYRQSKFGMMMKPFHI